MNLVVARKGGDPGGDGGMSKFATVGRVRVRIKERSAVYGEPGSASSGGPDIVGGGDAVGPRVGPLRGPCSSEGWAIGAGSGFEDVDNKIGASGSGYHRFWVH